MRVTSANIFPSSPKIRTSLTLPFWRTSNTGILPSLTSTFVLLEKSLTPTSSSLAYLKAMIPWWAKTQGLFLEAIAHALAAPIWYTRPGWMPECSWPREPNTRHGIHRTYCPSRNRGKNDCNDTHKLQVMQMCDWIIVLEGGGVKDQGSFDELIANKGLRNSHSKWRVGQWLNKFWPLTFLTLYPLLFDLWR